jgi:hypothetical protein
MTAVAVVVYGFEQKADPGYVSRNRFRDRFTKGTRLPVFARRRNNTVRRI